MTPSSCAAPGAGARSTTSRAAPRPGRAASRVASSGLRTIELTGLERAFALDWETFTLTSPNSAVPLTLAAGKGLAGEPAVVIGDAGGPTTMAPVTVYSNVGNFGLTIDAATNDVAGGGASHDQVTLTSGLDSGVDRARYLQDLTIQTGAGGTDQVIVNGVVNIPGALLIDHAETVAFHADVTAEDSLKIQNAAQVNLAGAVAAAEIDVAALQLTMDDGGALRAGAGNVTLTADRLHLVETANAISGAGTITLQPASPAAPVELIASGEGSGFSLNASELAAIESGFAMVTIGASDGNRRDHRRRARDLRGPGDPANQSLRQ